MPVALVKGGPVPRMISHAPSQAVRRASGLPTCVGATIMRSLVFTRQYGSHSILRQSRATKGSACRASVTVVASAAATGTSLKKISDSELSNYIAQGVIAKHLGLAAEVTANLGTWRKLGGDLAGRLQADADNLNEAQMSRIFHYYLPTYVWCNKQLVEHRAKYAARGEAPPAFVVGISAPQGCGKTTIVEQLQELFNAAGTAAASVSLDDFYLTGAEQDALAERYPDNGLLRFRGNAGSHDLKLAGSSLESLRNCTAKGQRVPVPRYDKSLRGGRGDRAPEASWPAVEGPLQVVLLEGWMLGFRPVGPEAAAKVDPSLGQVDMELKAYEQVLESKADAWVVVRVGDPQWVFKWRLQAEVQMRSAGKPGLTDEQVADFVKRFIPAYEAYLPGLYGKEGPTGRKETPRLFLQIDDTRTLRGAS